MKSARQGLPGIGHAFASLFGATPLSWKRGQKVEKEREKKFRFDFLTARGVVRDSRRLLR